jgi:hypothetical protein
MNFLQSWDIEKVGGKLISQLDEFPTEREKPVRGRGATSAHLSNKTFQAWEELDFEARSV